MIFRTDVKSTLLYLALLTGAAVSQQAIALQNNESLENLSGSQGSTVFHTLTVPRGASQLSIGISGGRGDADLYVKIGSRPSTSSYNCRPYRNGNSTGTVTSPRTWLGVFERLRAGIAQCTQCGQITGTSL